MQRSKRAHSPRPSTSNSKPSPPPKKLFRSAGQSAGTSAITTQQSPSKMLGESRFNPSARPPVPNPYSLPPYAKTTATTPTNNAVLDVDNDRSSVSDNDSVHSPQSRAEAISIHASGGPDDKPKPAPGKKTRGRVKIEMQYIQNKLRRYTTFSKRKSGIMKKAYELSTLTGTQVMLLVASETGHVYTFATPKLQPMITSEAGKALIQTCLHTPDPAPQQMEYDIRMSATGYEETELGYGLSEEDAFKTGLEASGHPAGQILSSSSVALPPNMMQMPYPSVTLPEHHQSIGSILPPAGGYQLAVSTGPSMSPHSHSPPPSYSPSAHNNSPRGYPTSPSSISYSQASHIPSQHIMMEELVGSGSSPLRKSPDSHYLPHHHFDRSPSHSPMTTVHFPMRTHSPPHQIYAHSGGSPSQLANHSPIPHM